MAQAKKPITVGRTAPKHGAAPPPPDTIPVSLRGTAMANEPYTRFTPNQTVTFPTDAFGITFKGAAYSFLPKHPRVISAALRAAILSGSKVQPAAAHGTVTVSGTPAVGNTITITVGTYVVTYTLVAGDTTLATLATHLVAALNSVTGIPAVATSSGAVVTITASLNGVSGNSIVLAATKVGAVVVTASSSTLTNGVDGSLIN